MPFYSIWRIQPNGETDWISGSAPGESASEALERSPGASEGKTYFVVGPLANPNGRRSLFRMERADRPLRAVPVTRVDAS